MLKEETCAQDAPAGRLVNTALTSATRSHGWIAVRDGRRL